MAAQGELPDPAVALDSSVVIEYIYSDKLEEVTDTGITIEDSGDGVVLIESDEFNTAIGGKVRQEINNRVTEEYKKYMEITNYMGETGYKLTNFGVNWSREVDRVDSDEDIFDIQVSLAECDEINTLQDELRELNTVMTSLSEIADNTLEDEIDAICTRVQEPNSSGELKKEFRNRMDIGHDTDVIIDAVYMSMKNGVGVLASYDRDMSKFKTKKEIKDIVSDIHPEVTIDIINPNKTNLDDLK